MDSEQAENSTEKDRQESTLPVLLLIFVLKVKHSKTAIEVANIKHRWLRNFGITWWRFAYGAQSDRVLSHSWRSMFSLSILGAQETSRNHRCLHFLISYISDDCLCLFSVY